MNANLNEDIVEEKLIEEKKSDMMDMMEDMAYSPYMDLFFPFIIEKEHRLSEQAIVLAGYSV